MNDDLDDYIEEQEAKNPGFAAEVERRVEERERQERYRRMDELGDSMVERCRDAARHLKKAARVMRRGQR